MSALAGRDPNPPLSRSVLYAFWLFAFAVYAAYFQAQWLFGERPIYHITGDEPHYLLVATSLIRDGDLDVLNNYRDKDYLDFYPYHLGDPRDPTDMHALYGPGGRLYSKHGLGLSLLLLPAVRLGGSGPATLFMIALAAALSVQTLLLSLETVRGRGEALLAWLAISFSAPLLLFAGLFYPEVPGALLTVIGLRATLALSAQRPRYPAYQQALRVGLAVGLLPWLHLRYIPLAAALFVAAVATYRPWRLQVQAAVHDLRRSVPAHWWSRRRPAAPTPDPSHLLRLRRSRSSFRLLSYLLTPALVGGASLLALDWQLFGGVPPVDEYGAVALSNVLAGAPGLLIDAQYGLLIYAPVFLVALYGLPLVSSTLPAGPGRIVLALLGVYFVFIACFSVWYGAFSPPARMLVPVVPLLVVPLSLALSCWRGVRFRALLVLLLLLGWSIAHLLVDVPRLRYNLPDGRSHLLDYLSRVWRMDLSPLLPSFVRPSAGSYLWAIGASLTAWMLWYVTTQERAMWRMHLTMWRQRLVGPR